MLKQEELSEGDIAAVAQAFKRLEAYLGTQLYIAGNFSLADCAVMPMIATLEAFPAIQPSITFGRAFQNYANGLKKRAGYKGASLFSFEAAAVPVQA